MNDEVVGDAAAELLDMRANRRVVPDLPLPLRPQTLTDAYAIQDRVVAALVAQAWWPVHRLQGRVHQRDRAGCLADRSTAVRPADVAEHLAERHDAGGRPVHPSRHRGRVRFPRRRRRRTSRWWPYASHDRRAHRRADTGHRDRRLPVRVMGGRCVAHRRRQRDPRLVAARRAGRGLAAATTSRRRRCRSPETASSSRPARARRCSVIRST